MADSTTLTLRLPAETKNQLAKLAGYTRRTQSFLGAEAITDYVARELAVVEAITRGRADVRVGRVTPHDTVRDETRRLIEAARTTR